MLPKEYRLRDHEHYNLVVRQGKRAGNKYLVIHHLTGQFGASVPLVGFIVSKRQVPRAVQRNLVKRRLRAMIWRHRHLIAADQALVIRVNAAATQTSSAVLEQKLLSLLHRLGVVARESWKTPKVGQE